MHCVLGKPRRGILSNQALLASPLHLFSFVLWYPYHSTSPLGTLYRYLLAYLLASFFLSFSRLPSGLHRLIVRYPVDLCRSVPFLT